MSTQPEAALGPEASRPGRRPTGYTVVLPPGWYQIPVRDGTADAIRKIVDKTFAHPPEGVPRDRVTPYRLELERRLSEAARQARRGGGVHLYLPVEMRHGALMAASFVVSEGSLGSLEDIRPELVVSYLASGNAATGADGNQPVTVDGAPGLRMERTAPAKPSDGIDYGSRRVDYVIPVPDEQDRWLVVAFSTLGGGDPDDEYARILAELFDAIMSTFRWTRAERSSPDGGRRE
jgi:hypothetical protein